ncbi:MAG: transposase [Acidimicrobiales bacterium]
MRALDPEVFDAVWGAVEPLLPARPEVEHPLGCHRRRVSDRLCFKAIVIRLVTGCSWVDAERFIDQAVSDTTLRARRDEWERAGVFSALVEEALSAYDRVIGLDLSETAVDGSQHKAPMGGEADRGKLGWKWSLLTDRAGIPIGWTTNGANRHDLILFDDTLEDAGGRGLLADIETLHLDRGYDCRAVRDSCSAHGLTDVICAKQRSRGGAPKAVKLAKITVPLGDRRIAHRLAQLALAIVFLITAKLIDWRNRWSR